MNLFTTLNAILKIVITRCFYLNAAILKIINAASTGAVLIYAGVTRGQSNTFFSRNYCLAVGIGGRLIGKVRVRNMGDPQSSWG